MQELKEKERENLRDRVDMGIVIGQLIGQFVVVGEGMAGEGLSGRHLLQWVV